MLKSLEKGHTSRSRGQKSWYQQRGLLISNTHIKYESPITYHSKDNTNVKVFRNRVKLQGQEIKITVPLEGRVIKNTHMKYDISITYHSKDMANVQVFKT
jgi:hypothetical protein